MSAILPMTSRCRWTRSRSPSGVARDRTYPSAVGPVERLAPGRDVEVGHRVDHRLRWADLDASDRVDQVSEPGEPDLHVVVHANPGRGLHSLNQQLRAAEGVRGVDLVVPPPGDLDQRVPRDAHQHGVAATVGHVHQQDRVGATPLHVTGAELSLLLGCEVVAAVRAHDQVVAPWPILGSASIRLRVNRVDAEVGHKSHSHQVDQPRHEQDDEPANDRPWSRRLPATRRFDRGRDLGLFGLPCGRAAPA